MSSSNCCFLTCMEVSQEAGQVVCYSHVLKNCPQFLVIHTVKGFGVVNKAEIDVFLELSCFFDDPEDVGNLISGSSAFSKPSLYNWKFSVHVLLKPGLEKFENYFPRVWSEWSHSVVSNSLQPHGLYPARLSYPWDFTGKNTRVGCHSFFRESSWPRDQTCIFGFSSIDRQSLYRWATWETNTLISEYILCIHSITFFVIYISRPGYEFHL